MNRVWLVTGANSGFGRAITEAAIGSGDFVVATARRTSAVDDLAATYPDQLDVRQLDVTSRSSIETTVADLITRHGRIDVLVNNAGRSHVGAVEETRPSSRSKECRRPSPTRSADSASRS
jgi:NAD(P)-dependent dehydrogenase (short-subunit alcohol dehydrogenase family)